MNTHLRTCVEKSIYHPSPGHSMLEPSRGQLKAAVCFAALLVTFLSAFPAFSQNVKTDPSPLVFDPALHAKASNRVITVGVHRSTGQFWIETIDGVPILFNAKGGITSFTNVHAGRATYTNNDLHNGRSPEGTERMPFGSISEQPDRVVFTSRMQTGNESVQLTQEFIPGLENDYAYVRIRSTVKNLSAMPLTAGLQMMYDLRIGTDDNPRVTVGGAGVSVEREWRDAAIPATWDAVSPGSHLLVRARVSGQGTSMPEQLVIGRWAFAGYLGGAAWNYAPSALTMWDNAALLQWAAKALGPGEEFSIVTDYGYVTLLGASLACQTEEVHLNNTFDGYVPNPFEVKATIYNSGTLSIVSADVRITVPADATLDAGEPTAKSIIGPILPGATETLRWRVRVLPSPTARLLTFGFDITNPSALHQNCSASVNVPATINNDPCTRDGVSTRGTDFWAVFPAQPGQAVPSYRIFVTGQENTALRVQQTQNGQMLQRSFLANTVETIEIGPAAAATMVTESNQGISLHISSDKPVSVALAPVLSQHSEAALALPTAALGTSYVVAGYEGATRSDHVVVVATADNTDVTVVPTCRTSGGHDAAVPFGFRLQRGQSYLIRAASNAVWTGLTGSSVVATQQVAVFAGTVNTTTPFSLQFPSPDSCMHFEQCIPDALLGNSYVAVPAQSRNGGDTFRIIATTDATMVTVGTAPPVLLATRGAMYECTLQAATMITSTKPILLAQYTNSPSFDSRSNTYGDGSMVLLPPVGRYATCHDFTTDILPHVMGGGNQGMRLTTGSWIEVADNPTIAIPAFTAECWIKFRSGGLIVTRDAASGTPSDWQLWCDWAGKRLAFITARVPPDSYFYTANNSIVPDTWYHLAIAVDGPKGHATLYMNGVPVITPTFSSRQFDAVTGLAWGGYFRNASGAYLNATIDEARYWNYERSASEIVACKDRRLRPDERNGLVGYWSFCGDMADSSSLHQTTTARGGIALETITDHSAALSCNTPDTTRVFVSMVVAAGAEQQVRVDGVPCTTGQFAAVPNSSFLSAQVEVTPGVHHIETSDTRGVGVVVHGFGDNDAFSMSTGFLTGFAGPAAAINGMPPNANDLQLTLSPNPLRDNAVVTFVLPQAGLAHLTLCDMLGRVRVTLASDSYPCGVHQLRFDASALPAGSYLLVLRNGNARLQRSMVILR